MNVRLGVHASLELGFLQFVSMCVYTLFCTPLSLAQSRFLGRALCYYTNDFGEIKRCQVATSSCVERVCHCQELHLQYTSRNVSEIIKKIWMLHALASYGLTNHSLSSFEGLNNLQSGIHRQYMKDLFVELCLTVPVRLR